MPLCIINHLGINMVQAAENAQPRPGSGAAYLFPDPMMSSYTCFSGISIYSFLFPANYFTGFARFKMYFFSGISDALAFIRVRRRRARISAAISPTTSLLIPLTFILVCPSTARVIPGSGLTSTGCEKPRRSISLSPVFSAR